MLMRRFLSMTEYSQQGFEASHKDQRQLWLKASSHDRHGESSSIDQMLVHFYAEKLLFLRYCIREALNVIRGKSSEQQRSYAFYFRGCGWKPKNMAWDSDEVLWIRLMDKLMTMMLGGDFLNYDFDRKKICHVTVECKPAFIYKREDWLEEYVRMVNSDDMNMCIEEEHADESLQTLIYSVPEDPIPVDKNHSAENTDTSSDLGVSRIEDRLPSNQFDLDSVVAVFPPRPSVPKIGILQMDVDTLVDGQELNDSIVDFFMMYTVHSMDHDVDGFHVFSSFFYTRLSERKRNGQHFVLPSAEEHYRGAASFTRKVDIFEKDFLFIPVCRSGHWFLALVYNLPSLHDKGAPIFMIDSIVWGCEDTLCDTPSSREQEAELIRSFIRCHWLATRGIGDSTEPEFSIKTMPLFYPKVPQQENGYDCGVFLLLFFEEFLRRKFPVDDLLSGKPLRWYCQSSALPLRKKITNILVQLDN